MKLVKKSIVLGAFLTLFLSGCSQYEDLVNGSGEYPKETLVTFQAVAQNSPMTPVSDVNCYTFKDGIYYASQQNVTTTADGHLSLNVVMGAKLYFLTNVAQPASLASLEKGVTTEAEFLQLRSDKDTLHSADRAPEFYSGLFEVKAVAEGDNRIELKSSVARVDLDLTSDPQIAVQRVEVSGASATAQIFGTQTPLSSSEKINYERLYTTPVEGLVEDVFRIYESSTPISIKVHGTLNGVPFTCVSQTSRIERNKIYTIRVENAGASFTGSFDIKEWESGDIIESKPDVTGKIRISAENSVLPTGSVIDAEATTLSVPYTGGNVQLAFLSDGPIDLVSINGINKDFSVDSIPQITPDGEFVVTKYNVSIKEQGDGRLSYSVDLRLKSAFREHDYDKVTLLVNESPKQIQTVTIGGNTWMAFNTRSSTFEDQVYLTDGNTVEQMYINNWISTIGNLFQYGRNYGYTPWKSGTNNQGKVVTNLPWTTEEHIPCPPGYRNPSRAELRSILPDGQVIPGKFTSNDEELEINIVRSNPQNVSISGISGKGNSICITSPKTGQKLFIPMAGQKPDKSGATSPDLGRGFTLWSSEYAGASGGHAWTTHTWPGDTSNTGAIGKTTQLPQEGFAYLRCIKKK